MCVRRHTPDLKTDAGQASVDSGGDLKQLGAGVLDRLVDDVVGRVPDEDLNNSLEGRDG